MYSASLNWHELTSPIRAKSESPWTLIRVSSVRYRCGASEQLQTTYYALRDHSLAFVRLVLPDGRQLMLPQVASANGEF